MKIIEDDIWNYIDTHWITITVNQGWTRSKGDNIMGRGIAKQAADRFPELPAIYGEVCRSEPGAEKVHPIVFNNSDGTPSGRLIMFPTKRLNKECPWLSWKSRSSVELINNCMLDLEIFSWTTDRPIVIPPFGCGNGGLSIKSMKPKIEKYFANNEKILLVLQKKEAENDSPLPY